MSGDESEYESRAAERLFAFSDAVVAIAMTLLALDLPVPEGGTASEFWVSVRHNDSHYLAFLISFGVIALGWIQHHDMVRYTVRSDTRLRQFNLLWLLAIVLNPFATRLLTTNGQDALYVHALRFGFYAFLQVLATGALLAMVRRMRSHRLLASDASARFARDTDWRSYGILLGFGLSIPVFFATTYGWVLWAAVPVTMGQVRRRLERDADADATD